MNWIINNTIIFNTKLLKEFGFNPEDKIAVLYSKLDQCFYVSKTNLGDNKLCIDTGNGVSLRTRNKYVTEKLGCEPTIRMYFDIYQDEQDKLNNAIKCIIKKE